MTAAEDKRMLRLQYKARRKAVSQQEREASSEAVCRRAYPFMKALRERHARPLHLCAYFPFGNELDITALLLDCRQHGDAVYLPRTEASSRTMTLHPWTEDTVFTSGTFGLQEPGPDAERLDREHWDRLDAILVPGIAYDRQGGRLGLGAGYYDRFWHAYLEVLDRAPHGRRRANPAVRVACIYSWQLAERVPMEAHDIAVEWLITEDEIIACAADTDLLTGKNGSRG
ncbi:5-formyltetrahydrofolate cyclo-ligase [Paenibacillus thiaminolyticus]|uniref:5-formyltetrahydrofolate cyclo-ligase n=1 Tax=Paenibacillus thiaminolyticus TaxID=49283 RepID=UPI002542A0D3|nr:5-formyltetrahydrofolate cyclo-ligase [Paenibacillus thiaminolyticus]WII36867.1 5-formyltetrahydrofolate cyclo-ligase [Paenibacillus thiaminolyticus]